MQDKINLLSEYAGVFRIGTVLDHSGEQYVYADTASYLISFLRFLEKINDFPNPNGLLRIQKQKDSAQNLLQRFYCMADGDILRGEDFKAISDFFDDDYSSFKFLESVFTKTFEMNPQAKFICRGVLSKREEDGFVGEVLVNQKIAAHYDRGFGGIASKRYATLKVDEGHGVYELSGPLIP